jgi:hypothetical protein
MNEPRVYHVDISRYYRVTWRVSVLATDPTEAQAEAHYLAEHHPPNIATDLGAKVDRAKRIEMEVVVA